MKVLYANPIFLDYRIPFYKRLIELFECDFYVLYSSNRYKGRFDALLERIPQELGDNAVAYNKERAFYINSFSFKYKAVVSENKKSIFPYAVPFTVGLKKAVATICPDVIISEGFYQWTPLLCWYCHRHHVPLYINYERTLYTERYTGYLKTLERKWVDKYVKGYFVNGSETSKYLESIGVSPNRIYLGGMSADSSGLRQSIASMSQEDKLLFKKRLKSGCKGLMFLFSGQMIERKGVGHLLESWMEHINHFPDDILILIGGGPLYDQYKTQYGGEPSIFIEGRIPYSEVYKYYAVADVFVLPTIEDNWSLVIPEAMACGLPVATSVYNGCYPELVKKGVNGITFDTFNHSSIVEALGYFHTQDLKEFGRNSIKLEEPFNTDNSAQRFHDVIVKG